jgi:chaperonin cofactor prefoldin
MTDTNNLVLEHLRAIRADVSDIKNRMDRVELRLSVIEQTVGGIFAMMGSDREALQSLARRVERIEHRLELTETH